MAKKRKIRVDLRKNRSKPAREQGWTREYHAHGFAQKDDTVRGERIRAKGDLSRRRTIMTETPANAQPASDSSLPEMPAVDLAGCQRGRVLRAQGLFSVVAAEDGRQIRCSVRRLLRNLVIDERNIIVTGDLVWFRPSGSEEGVIEQVEPRKGILTRASQGKEQIIATNVDQAVFVVSLAEPAPKPHLIDRYLASAEQAGIPAILCMNKTDLVDLWEFQPLIGLNAQLGVPVVLTSIRTGAGIDSLRNLLKNKETVFSGQSGVGKSSLLNALHPELGLRVREVSDVTQKGKHTTTTAELVPLNDQTWVVDTPGIRQFALSNIELGELEGLFIEFRPFVPYCRFPNCTHIHEDDCTIKTAVRKHHIAVQRYESYVGLFMGKD